MFGIDFYQFSQWVLKSSCNRDGATQIRFQVGHFLLSNRRDAVQRCSRFVNNTLREREKKEKMNAIDFLVVICIYQYDTSRCHSDFDLMTSETISCVSLDPLPFPIANNLHLKTVYASYLINPRCLDIHYLCSSIMARSSSFARRFGIKRRCRTVVKRMRPVESTAATLHPCR